MIANGKLLIIGSDGDFQRRLCACFGSYDVVLATGHQHALSELRRHEPPVILHDVSEGPGDTTEQSLATLKDIVALAPHSKVIVVTGQSDRTQAAQAFGLGAYDFYHRPFDAGVLQFVVARAFRIFELEAENRRLADLRSDSPLDGVIAVSDAMLRVCRIVEKVAPANVTTLLQGESGTGKELLARALHNLSPRKNQAFVAINCAAIPENLLESELFGHEKGAFTGAVKQTSGKIETADKGTLLLDEVGDMPLALQAKLLRFLQERVVERVGGRKEIPVDVRVICATNRHLPEAIKQGNFRDDLYYRISEITIDIPPLRERHGGRIVLARHLLHRFATQQGRQLKGLSDDAQDAIDAYAWPGNVRELENKMKAAVIMAEGKYVTAADLGLALPDSPPSLNLRAVRQQAETRAIRQALIRTSGNVSKAADLLGVTRPTLYDLMQKYELRSD